MNPDLADIVIALIKDAHPDATVKKVIPYIEGDVEYHGPWVIKVNESNVGVVVDDVFSSAAIIPFKTMHGVISNMNTLAEIMKPTDPDFVDRVLHYARLKGNLKIPG